MSERSIAVAQKAAPPVLSPAPRGVLQRACACGQHAMGGECEGCKQKKTMLQRKSDGAPGPNIAPPIVHEVLRAPGRPLDADTRAFFEPRLARLLGKSRTPMSGPSAVPQDLVTSQPWDSHEREADRFAERLLGSEEATVAMASARNLQPSYDLSRVRVHTDQRAAESAQAVNARAFTVGQSIVFGAGTYPLRSSASLGLLAHELAHTIQQFPGLSRQPKDIPSRPLPPHDPRVHTAALGACLGSAICRDLFTPTKLLAEQEVNPANKAKRDHRKQVCRNPADPACKAGGHGAPATQLQKVLHDYDPARLRNTPLIVDKDLEEGFRALTIRCDRFVPPISGATDCVTVPETMEQEAARFNTTMNPTIAGEERGKWRERTLEILFHETGHVQFREAFRANRVLASQPECFTQDVLSALNELTAMMNEFPLRIERLKVSVGFSPEDREKEMDEWRERRIRGTRQSITVSLRTVRCSCNCDEANKMIKETIEFATHSWTQELKNQINREMRDPRWSELDLRWPFVAPSVPDVPRPVPERAKTP